jgi:hypothetical protein
LRALESLDCTIQKTVGPYTVDLYIPVHRICVVSEGYDEQKYKYLLAVFGKANVIMYNPDKRGFSELDVINEIVTAVVSSLQCFEEFDTDSDFYDDE